MKIMIKILWIFPVALLSFVCCRNETEVLTGDIEGYVRLYDEYSMPVSDLAGVDIEIQSTGSAFQTVTDTEGRFTFTGIPLGKYGITMDRTGFLITNERKGPPLSYDEFYHEGGPAGTLLQLSMYEIPGYTYHLDSGSIDWSRLSLYCTGPDIDNGSFSGLQYFKAVCFIDSTREVSRDRYMIYAFGVFMEYPVYQNPDYSSGLYFISYFRYYGGNLNGYDKDTVYVRLYPVTMGEEFYSPLRFESLGASSNIIGIYVPHTDPMP